MSIITLQNEDLTELNTFSKFEGEGITNQDLLDSQNSDPGLKSIIAKVLTRDNVTCLNYRLIDGLLQNSRRHSFNLYT